MNNYQNLCENLKQLKLTHMSFKMEIKNFNATNAMVKLTGFPHLKEMKDFGFQPKINK